MKVLKFGGTSVGSPARMKCIYTLTQEVSSPCFVVLSAVSGTTNSLVEISALHSAGNLNEASVYVDELEKKYGLFVEELYDTSAALKEAEGIIQRHFQVIREQIQGPHSPYSERIILSVGELLSTHLFTLYSAQKAEGYTLLEATEIIRLNEKNEPDYAFIRRQLRHFVDNASSVKYVIQGFICSDSDGQVTNLKRGGSDYTASIIGAALEAEEIQIWTDIDGMHNNDPRWVEGTQPIRRLSFDEAAELAYFGAKILHPTSILPAKEKNIPVRLKNTMKPDAPGTIITDCETTTGVLAIAAKDDITAIKIKSGRMLLAYGFLRKIFEVFESYKTPIDMITTSEVAVSITIDDPIHLSPIETELKKYAAVEIDHDLSIICVVGNFIADSKGYAAQIFQALQDIPIRMISYGGSKHNISILVHSHHKIEALQRLHLHLFQS